MKLKLSKDLGKIREEAKGWIDAAFAQDLHRLTFLSPLHAQKRADADRVLNGETIPYLVNEATGRGLEVKELAREIAAKAAANTGALRDLEERRQGALARLRAARSEQEIEALKREFAPPYLLHG